MKSFFAWKVNKSESHFQTGQLVKKILWHQIFSQPNNIVGQEKKCSVPKWYLPWIIWERTFWDNRMGIVQSEHIWQHMDLKPVRNKCTKNHGFITAPGDEVGFLILTSLHFTEEEMSLFPQFCLGTMNRLILFFSQVKHKIVMYNTTTTFLTQLHESHRCGRPCSSFFQQKTPSIWVCSACQPLCMAQRNPGKGPKNFSTKTTKGFTAHHFSKHPFQKN